MYFDLISNTVVRKAYIIFIYKTYILTSLTKNKLLVLPNLTRHVSISYRAHKYAYKKRLSAINSIFVE